MGCRSAKNSGLVEQARKPRRRGRKLALLLGLAGLGAAVARSLKEKNLSPAAPYEAPKQAPYVAPTPPPAPPAEPVAEVVPDPAPPVDEPVQSTSELILGIPAEPTPEPVPETAPDTVADPLVDPLSEGAPVTGADDGSFFEQVMAETKTPPRRRTRRAPKDKAAE